MLPAVLVYTNNEETTTETITRPRSQSRTLTLQIEIYAKATGNVDEVTDTIAGEIEEAIADAPSLNGLCKDIRLTATTVQLTFPAVVTFHRRAQPLSMPLKPWRENRENRCVSRFGGKRK